MNITWEDVAHYPRPGTAMASKFAFSRDGSTLAFRMSAQGDLVHQLYAMDVASGTVRVWFDPLAHDDAVTEADLSPEEQLRRERQRERALGVSDFAWAADAARMLIPVGGELWFADGPHATPRRLDPHLTKGALAPKLSPDGAYVAFVKEGALTWFSTAASASETTQVSPPTGRTFGLAEYIAQEEMDRADGFWWAPDGSALAFCEVDEQHIPVHRIEHAAAATPTFEDHRYPFAGGPNARVRLGVVPRSGKPIKWMQLALPETSEDAEFYLARVHWSGTLGLLVQLQDRRQQHLWLQRLDPKTGAATTLVHAHKEPYLNLHNLLAPVEDGPLAGAFVWGNENSGAMQLELRTHDGALIRPLTHAPWPVERVAHIDGEHVYFLAAGPTPLQRHLFRVSLEGGEPEPLTSGEGMHDAVLDRKATHMVESTSTLARPPAVQLRTLTNGRAQALEMPSDARLARMKLQPPEQLHIPADDGTQLHAALYRPTGKGPFPTLVDVYGGPHVQRVQDSWDLTADVRAQALRERGYAVLRLDGRGSARRGLAFESAIAHNLGDLEIADQVAGVRYLVSQGITDAARVGIYGWSYGGYLAAMALGRAPQTFKMAIAGAPVTHWDGYDTHYTERYMGLPSEHAAAYAASSVMAHVPTMRGNLLLIHGGLDENVHVRHSLRLVQALIDARASYELLLFPSERHMPRSESDRAYLEMRMFDFVERTLRASP